MLNLTLFKRTLKSSYVVVIIFMSVLVLYFSIIAGMYDPENLDIVNLLAEMKLSPELLAAMGFTLTDTSLVGFLSSYFYGFLMLALPMVCYIILANKLVAGLTEKGSLTYLMATPNTRIRIVSTQATFLIVSITAMVGLVTCLGLVLCQAKFPDLLDIKGFLLLNLGVLLTHFAISGISFLASCLFNESKTSLMVGAGLPTAFLLIQMISNTGEELEKFKYATIFTLFNPSNIIKGENYIIPFFILAVIAILFYGSAILIFNKKDLPV